MLGSPLEDLSHQHEGQSHGQHHIEVRSFGVDEAIPVLQVLPAQTLREPEPLIPEHLTKPCKHADRERERERKRGLIHFHQTSFPHLYISATSIPIEKRPCSERKWRKESQR